MLFPMTRFLLTICRLTTVLLAVAACSGEVYVRDGVTDGDTFYLAQRALSDDDPVLQSWVTYSLARSTCQLEMGGENPARQSSFDCELTARELLLQSWFEKKLLDPARADAYLDELARVERAGYLREYVAKHHRKRHWDIPDDLDLARYRRWADASIPGHEPETRIIGSWNYAGKVFAD